MALNATKAVQFALAQVGKKYVFGTTGPDAFDCSGLVEAAWEKGGKWLPHNTSEQVEALKAVPYTPEARKKLVPGDLVFYYGSVGSPLSVTHVAMYVGRNKLTRTWDVVAAVDENYGVKRHRMFWALKPSGLGYVGHH